jgi:small subunit ribosomal protein S20
LALRHKSAIKRHRQSLKRAARNKAVRTRIKHVLRELRETIARGDLPAAEEKLRLAVKTLTKAVSKGVLHRNNASRRISRLSQRVARLRQPQAA